MCAGRISVNYEYIDDINKTVKIKNINEKK